MNTEETRDETPEWMVEAASKWKAPGVPESLDRRVLRSYRKRLVKSWWRRALAVGVPVPAPVLAAALILVAVILWSPGPSGSEPRASALPDADAPGLSAVVIPFDLSAFEPCVDGPVQYVEFENK